MNATQFVKSLYANVDSKNLNGLAGMLDEEVRFKFANHDAVNGMEDTLQANEGFFSSINSMRHSFNGIWQQGDTIICNGQVHYVRLNGSECSAEFATILTIRNEKITNYLIYADVSEL